MLAKAVRHFIDFMFVEKVENAGLIRILIAACFVILLRDYESDRQR